MKEFSKLVNFLKTIFIWLFQFIETYMSPYHIVTYVFEHKYITLYLNV